MGEPNKTIKIRLKEGDKPGEVLAWLKENSLAEVCFLLERDFLVVTESSFIQRLQGLIKSRTGEVYFVTKKPYFQTVLSQHKLRVQGYEPEHFAEVPAQTFSELQGKVAAAKNAFEKKSIEFKPKIQTSGSRPQFSTRKIENLTHEKSLRGIYFFVFLLLIAILGLLFFWVSPRAEIVIKPRINTTEVTQNIVVGLPGALFDETDENLPKVGGIRVQTEKSATQTFASTGREYDITNARGQITLFNETSEPKFLVPSRLKTDEGVIVRTQANVTIPARAEGKPGRISVEVVADAYDEEENPIGERGNIDAGTDLFFPALRRETRELYYGKANQGPLVGGSTLTTYFVTPDDHVLAEPLLSESLRIQAIDSLKTELERRSNREAKDYILIEQASVLQSILNEFVYDEAQTDQTLQAFEVSGVLTLDGLVFDQDQVITIMAEKLRQSQDDRKKMVNIDEGSIEYRILDTEDYIEQGWVKLSVTLTGVETLDFEAENEFAREWQSSIKKEILGRGVEEARGLLLNHPEIESIIRFEVSPFWLQKLPVLVDQIKLEVAY